MSRPVLPPLLLIVYGLAFAAAALGRGVLAFDDHPGQLYRLWHALRLGLAPWRWDPGWWAGYPELQFYPPGFSYAGVVVHSATLGALAPESVYQVLLWATYLLPGAATSPQCRPSSTPLRTPAESARATNAPGRASQRSPSTRARRA